jgi:hypothetical protein
MSSQGPSTVAPEGHSLAEGLVELCKRMGSMTESEDFGVWAQDPTTRGGVAISAGVWKRENK